ncbi:MAG: sulfite exporter TauE/SafE family protein [Solidesulfovibrio sp. DCME]|uniref:sulfite exporter TauE/SafE family protein n=1 Tax=Solidesulfovibrio sp. DCME TaxID=3447380 RepID=UPI003D0A8FF6
MSCDATAAILAGALAGAFVSGVSGFAFGLVALSFWAWQLDPPLLGPMVVFGSIVTQATSLAAIWARLDWPRLRPFLAGGVLGVPIGVLLLGVLDLRLFKATVGVVLVAYGAYLLLAPPRPAVRFGGRLADGAAGFVGGVMGGLAGLNGPAPVLWCTVRGWDKDVQRGIVQSYILAIQVVTFLGYGVAGKLTRPAWEAFGLMLPAVAVAAWLGARACHRVSADLFRRLVLVLLVLSGAALLADVLGHG